MTKTTHKSRLKEIAHAYAVSTQMFKVVAPVGILGVATGIDFTRLFADVTSAIHYAFAQIQAAYVPSQHPSTL